MMRNQGSIGSKATEPENTQIDQSGNAITMCLARRQQSHPGHSALHRFISNYPKTGLPRNTPLLETQETMTSVFRWVPQTDIVTEKLLTRGSSELSVLLSLVLAVLGNFTMTFLHTHLVTRVFRKAICHYTVAYSKNGKLCLTPVCLEQHVK